METMQIDGVAYEVQVFDPSVWRLSYKKQQLVFEFVVNEHTCQFRENRGAPNVVGVFQVNWRIPNAPPPDTLAFILRHGGNPAVSYRTIVTTGENEPSTEWMLVYSHLNVTLQYHRLRKLRLLLAA